MRQGIRLKHLNRSGTWPSGNPRFYYRPKGSKGIPLPDLPLDDPRFLSAYLSLTKPPPPKGTIEAWATAFQASTFFRTRSTATQAIWRRALADIVTRYGQAALKDLQAKHIRTDISRFEGNPANQRRKVWKAFCKWLEKSQAIASDPAKDLPKAEATQGEGHIPWALADIAAFRRKWQVGTPQRLAFEAIYWTGARMSDAVRMADDMLDATGWLAFTQEKTGGDVSIPIKADAPIWSRPMFGQAQLQACLAVKQGKGWMETAYGTQRSVKAASQWFAAAAREAGIVGKSAHGLRKSRAILMAERGATTHQIASWTGHESLSEVQGYSKKADRRRVIEFG